MKVQPFLPSPEARRPPGSDHGHRITFSPGPRVSPTDLRAGSRVSVHYRPTGSTGQVADDVEVLGPRGTGAR